MSRRPEKRLKTQGSLTSAQRACLSGDTELLQDIIEENPDVLNDKLNYNSFDLNLMHLAVGRGIFESVKFLTKNYRDSFTQNGDVRQDVRNSYLCFSICCSAINKDNKKDVYDEISKYLIRQGVSELSDELIYGLESKYPTIKDNIGDTLWDLKDPSLNFKPNKANAVSKKGAEILL